MGASTKLPHFYDALMNAYGPQGWWPAQTPTEVIVGTILTQNTAWKNVERAMARLRAGGALDWRQLHEMPVDRLAELIQPAGTFRVKAQRLKNFVSFLIERYRGDLAGMVGVSTDQLREELLSVHGIGRETADAILLYALDRPTFVVDAYTHRVLRRHGLIDTESDYDEVKAVFEDSLPSNLRMFNEFHALLVEVGKRHCRTRARCEGCPLASFEHDAER